MRSYGRDCTTDLLTLNKLENRAGRKKRPVASALENYPGPILLSLITWRYAPQE